MTGEQGTGAKGGSDASPSDHLSPPAKAVDLEEIDVKREELEVRHLEARKSLEQIRAEWWRRGDPLTLAILAAALGLVGNLATAIYNNNATVAQEASKAKNEGALDSRKAKYSLILQSIATNDPATATRNIKFFIDSGLLDDGDKRIRTALSRYSPVLPSANGDNPQIAGSPSATARYYGRPPNLDGKGQTIAMIELGGGFKQQDLTSYFSGSDIAPPSIISVGVDGAKNDPDNIINQAELDLEVAASVASKARYRVYFAPNTDKGFLDAINRAVSDHVSIINITWGSTESNWTEVAIQAFNQLLKKAAEAGITVVVATGDNGVTDGVADGGRHVDFPASSPWVLAVGGTSLHAAPGGTSVETAWPSSGGGESRIFERPSWQAGISIHPANSGKPGRLLPDLSASADPRYGYKLVLTGKKSVVGGTTIATPLVAGLIADINQALGRNVGFLTPSLYQGMSQDGILTSVTSGDNSQGGIPGYKAGPGWNAVTGWGVLDVGKAITWLRGHPNRK